MDLRSVGLTGKVAEKALDDIGITTNKNGIPFDQKNHSLQAEFELEQLQLHHVDSA